MYFLPYRQAYFLPEEGEHKNLGLSQLKDEKVSCLLGLKPWTSHQEEALNPVDFERIVKRLRATKHPLVLWVNRFLFEPELQNCLEDIGAFLPYLDGIMVSDFGLMYALRQRGYQGLIYLHTDTTITNSRDFSVLLDQGFDQIVLARELTLDEYKCIAKKHPGKVICPLFGHQIISTSRRPLLQAYAEQVGITLQSHTIYRMQEEKRQDDFLIYEDESGFHTFDGRFLHGLKYLRELQQASCYDFFLDSFAFQTEELQVLSHLVCEEEKMDKKIKYEHPSVDALLKRIHNPLEATEALWFTKTSESKEIDPRFSEKKKENFPLVSQELQKGSRNSTTTETDAVETVHPVTALEEGNQGNEIDHKLLSFFSTDESLASIEAQLEKQAPQLQLKFLLEKDRKEAEIQATKIAKMCPKKIMESHEAIELLAPAGDLARLKTAVLYGADAVFVGGKKFSLRSRASNFDLKALREGAAFAHQHKARLHVTVNMIPHEDDFEGIELYLKALQAAGVDAVIVASLAFLKLCKQVAPHMEVHISTQYSITNSQTIAFYQQLGADRVVLARETSLEELVSIRKNASLPLEVFVHGGMCVNYSGRCTLSNYMTLRDANRGGCAQSCRWRYRLYRCNPEDHYAKLEEISDKKILFTMSSKDLNAMLALPAFLDLEVASLKIEGRMKTDYYIATVVSAYRRALDNLTKLNEERKQGKIDEKKYEQEKTRIIKQGFQDLKHAENRETFSGFYFSLPKASGHIYGNGIASSHQRYVGNVLSYDSKTGLAEIQVRNPICSTDSLEVFGPYRYAKAFHVEELKNEQGEACERVYKAMEICTLKIPFAVEKGDYVRKLNE